MYYHLMSPLSVSDSIDHNIRFERVLTILVILILVVWYGVMVIRRGFYQGALFKFSLLIPANYPDGGCPVSIHNIVIESVYYSSTVINYCYSMLCVLCVLGV